MTEERDVQVINEPIDVVVGPNPTQQIVLVDVIEQQGIMGPPGPVGPTGPIGQLPVPAPGDLGKVPIVRPGPAWLVDMIHAADVADLGDLATLDTVDTAQIVDAAVTAAKLAAGAVLASLGYTPLNRALNLSDLSDPVAARTNLGLRALATLDAVGTPQITDASVTAPKLAAGVAAGNLGYVPLNKALNLSDVADVPTSRTNLGLKTAALQDIGTSGVKVPLLNAANTWSAAQLFSAASSADALRIVNAGNSAAFGLDPITNGAATDLQLYESGVGASQTWKAGGAIQFNRGYGAGLIQSSATGMLTSSNALTGTFTIGLASAGGVVNPLLVFNSAAWATGQGAELRICPTGASTAGVIRSVANGVANNADLELFTYNAGNATLAIQASPNGAIRFGAYGIPGFVMADSSGNLTSNSLLFNGTGLGAFTFANTSGGGETTALTLQNLAADATGNGVILNFQPSNLTNQASITADRAANGDISLNLWPFAASGGRAQQLQVLGNGTVSLPNGPLVQPRLAAASVRLSATANAVTGDGTGYSVRWDTIIFDRRNNFDLTNHWFLCPFTGLYLCTARLQFSSVATTANRVNFSFAKSGINQQPINDWGKPAPDGNSRSSVELVEMISASAGDNISVFVYIEGQAKTINILADLGTNAPCSTFNVVFLG